MTGTHDGAVRLTLHRPTRDELVHRQRWMRDPALMSYNVGWNVDFPGYDRATGCIDWPEEEWEAFHGRYVAGDPADRAYFYLRDPAGEYVGHAHYRTEGDEAHIGINVVPAHRGEGLSREGLRLLLDEIWARTGADVVVNEFEAERAAAVRLHEAAGFVRVGVTRDSGRDVIRWELRRA